MEKLFSRFTANIVIASLLYSCTGSSKHNEYIELKDEVFAFEKKVQNANLRDKVKANNLYEDLKDYETKMSKFNSSSYQPLRNQIERLKTILECQVSGISYVKMYCGSHNPYDVYIDGIKKWRIPPEQYLIEKIDIGEHLLGFEQVSGYILWKTNPSRRYNFTPCDTIHCTFPIVE